jgi:hypothetical protein
VRGGCVAACLLSSPPPSLPSAPRRSHPAAAAPLPCPAPDLPLQAHTSIRFGVGRFTTEAEVDRAVELTVQHVNKVGGWLPGCAWFGRFGQKWRWRGGGGELQGGRGSS